MATRFFAVGALAMHVEGGVAALATQALINPMYALHGMPRLRAGEAPEAVIAALQAGDAGPGASADPHPGCRRPDRRFTGAACVTWCGAVRGTDVSVAGNMLAGPAVVERTLEAFDAPAARWPERLLTALEAGEAAGGMRGASSPRR